MTRHVYTCAHVQAVEPHFTRPFVSVSADKSTIYAVFLLFNGQVTTAVTALAVEIEPIHSDARRAERKLVSRDHQSVTEILAALQHPRLTDLQPIELTSSFPPFPTPLLLVCCLVFEQDSMLHLPSMI